MIAVDWGSSSLRAFRLGAAGEVLEQRSSALGAIACEGRFESVLAGQIAGWNDPLLVLAGMVGSRQGWIEVPYVDCPATLRDIATGMRRADAAALPGRQVWIAPGLRYRNDNHAFDVLRGEEAQLCGLMQRVDTQAHLVCMPGTHSKWARIEGGCVREFFTAMTGEVFDILRKHSLLGRLMSGDSSLDRDAFLQGMDRARQSGGLLHHLFSVRTNGLMGVLQPGQLSSYLSGLLIAHELLDSDWCTQARGHTVHLIGAPALTAAYVLALRRFDIDVQQHDETLAATGLLALARAADLHSFS